MQENKQNTQNEVSLIMQKVQTAQNLAINEKYNIWLNANAGCGKTHVLTLRVLRFLLMGVEPAKILCLTYTKAAANEMKMRLFEVLSRWTSLKDTELEAEIFKITQQEVNKLQLILARQLFARVQDTPGGLKIQTIHSFCELLLHQFALEANIAHYFTTAQEEQLKQIFQQAFQRLLMIEEGEIGLNINILLKLVKENSFKDIFEKIIQDKYRILPFLNFKDELELENRLKTILSINYSELQVIGKIEKLLPSAELQALIAKSKNDKSQEFLNKIKKIEKIKESKDFAKIELAVTDLYCTAAGTMRKWSNVVGKNLLQQMPDAIKKLEQRQKFAINILKSLKLLELNKAIYILAKAFLEIYEKLKNNKLYLSFDDLLHYSNKLLSKDNLVSWVHYKLDSGLEHVLIDEAQDTSVVQWDIITKLIGEFYSGLAVKEQRRTIFAVGDEKQSIYSFQGANPVCFANNGEAIAYKARMAEQHFENVKLIHSFRSNPVILQAVDKIFANPENYKGLNAQNEPPEHCAVSQNIEGYVEIWPIFNDEQKTESQQNHNGGRELACCITQRISELLQKEGAEPRDIMILIPRRQRDFCREIIYQMKKYNIPIAGLDRVFLKNHIAVKDLCALGRFVLFPYDDLALASLFKSPLFELSEEDLYNIATNEGKGRQRSLWESLQNYAQEIQAQPNYCKNAEKISQMVVRLKKYLANAHIDSPFKFYSEILGRDGGRRNFIKYLGAEVIDILNEFINLSLQNSRTKNHNLYSFLSLIEKEDIVIKRENPNSNEVRLMTVHGAKGLEAPIVFLVDIGNAAWYSGRFIYDKESRPIYINSLAKAPDILQGILEHDAEKQEEENNRLLYVALTRAKEKLFICSYCSKKSQSRNWVEIAQQALQKDCQKLAPCDIYNIERLLFGKNSGKKPQLDKQSHDVDDKIDNLPLPEILLRDYQVKSDNIVNKISPNVAVNFIEKDLVNINKGQDKSPINFNKSDVIFSARQRGVLIHKILEYLPNINITEAESFIGNFLRNLKPKLKPEQQNSIFSDIVNFINQNSFKELFSSNSRSEVSIAGQLTLNGKKHQIVGQIDRLIILKDQVIFCDYKTGYAAKNIEDIPLKYVIQMGLYYRLLQKNYPDKNIRAILIYLNKLRYYELSVSFLEESLNKYFMQV